MAVTTTTAYVWTPPHPPDQDDPGGVPEPGALRPRHAADLAFLCLGFLRFYQLVASFDGCWPAFDLVLGPACRQPEAVTGAARTVGHPALAARHGPRISASLALAG